MSVAIGCRQHGTSRFRVSRYQDQIDQCAQSTEVALRVTSNCPRAWSGLSLAVSKGRRAVCSRVSVVAMFRNAHAVAARVRIGTVGLLNPSPGHQTGWRLDAARAVAAQGLPIWNGTDCDYSQMY